MLNLKIPRSLWITVDTISIFYHQTETKVYKDYHITTMVYFYVGAFLQATSRVPRWWIGERPPDMAASCDIYK